MMCRPHRPYEGLQLPRGPVRDRGRVVLIAPTRDCNKSSTSDWTKTTMSSSPLRGIATVRGVRHVIRGVRVLIAPTRDCNNMNSMLLSNSSCSPHRPYEGLQPAVASISTGLTWTCPHRPYEGLQRGPGHLHLWRSAVLIAPTRDCNDLGRAPGRAPPGRPHRPYEGLQLSVPTAQAAQRTWSSSPLRGIATG